MKRAFIYFLFIILLALLVFFYLTGFKLSWPSNRDILLIRIIRVSAVLFTGFSLSLNGGVLQSILGNPLAEPYLIGVSGGALLGYIIGLAIGLGNSLFLSIPAFIFALLIQIGVYMLSRTRFGLKSETLILSGLFVNFFASALVFVVAYLLNLSLERIIYLLYGSFSIILSRSEVFPFFIAIGIGTLLEISLIFFSREFDFISISEQEALAAGVHVDRIKNIVFIIVSLVTSFQVAAFGIIGFVGLIVPHITKSIVGKRHIDFLPLCFATGGILMILSDIIARRLFPFELPVGSITALIGVPFFFAIILRKRHEIS